MGRIAPDAADLVVWELNEATLPFKNKGSMGSSMDLATQSAGGWTANQIGRWGAAPLFPNGRVCNVYCDNVNFKPNFPFTVSLWLNCVAYMVWAMPLCRWKDSSYVGPYATWYPIQLAGEPGPRTGWWWQGLQTDGIGGGGGPPNSGDSQYDIQLGTWYHIGLTYDGTKTQTYWQGQKINESAATGNMLYTAGSVRTDIGATGYPENFNGYINDIRVANVVRSANWFSSVYNSAMSNPTANGAMLSLAGGGSTAYYEHRGWKSSESKFYYWEWTSPDPTGQHAPTSGLTDIVVLKTYTR